MHAVRHDAPAATPRLQRPRLRVGTILVAVALVPLVGTAVLTWNELDEARSLADQADDIERRVSRTADLTALDGAVLSEMIWGSTVRVASQIGLPIDLINSSVGEDVTALYAESVERTEKLLNPIDDDELAAQLTEARRADVDAFATIAAYGNATVRVDELLAESIHELRIGANGSGAGRELADATRTLELATEVRGAVSDGFLAYFASLFDVRGAPGDELARLIQIRSALTNTLDELAAMRRPDETPTPGLDRVRSSPVLGAFIDEVDDLIALLLARGVPDRGQTLGTLPFIENSSGLAAAYEAGATWVATTAELIDGSITAVTSGADIVRADADDSVRRAWQLTAALTVATALAAAIAGQLIVRPLHRLRRAADDLRTGAGPATIDVSGPAEVSAAAEAIREAAAHFALMTRQAEALARGELHDDVLGETAAGGLGAALRDSVGTLRTALARQDEFRRRLAHEASHDGLTKLPNRSASMTQLARSLARIERSGSELAVLFVDLDDFKDVNDHHGHHAGDAVLTTIAQRLVAAAREGDHVGRLGGDEFVVVAEPVDGIDAAVQLAHRIRSAVEEPIELERTSIRIGASIGVAMSRGGTLTADELLRDADLAGYRAKELGRGGVQVCDEALRELVARTADLSTALRHAIEHDELLLHYQPVVDSVGHRIRSFEALVRWRRPGFDGLVPPGEFIEVAERSTLIVDLDRWVIDRVVRQIAAWHSKGRFLDTPVAINVSGRHVGHHDIVKHVLDPLREHGVPPRSLIVEVTESALLDDLPTVATKLALLRRAGVAIAIDDFGTGYTSLAHLRALPVDILKIDRSFTASSVRDQNEASIVKLIIDTGHLMGASITAEGVETEDEVATLTGLGSDRLQGYYFAHPRPADDLAPIAAAANG